MASQQPFGNETPNLPIRWLFIYINNFIMMRFWVFDVRIIVAPFNYKMPSLALLDGAPFGVFLMCDFLQQLSPFAMRFRVMPIHSMTIFEE